RTEDDDLSPASLECPVGDSPEVEMVRVLGVVTSMLCKRERAQQNLRDLAHGCLQALTDGRVCGQGAKLVARHSQKTMELFNASHRHLVAAGARCDAADVEEPRPSAQLASDTDTRAAKLASAVPDRPAENAALTKDPMES